MDDELDLSHCAALIGLSIEDDDIFHPTAIEKAFDLGHEDTAIELMHASLDRALIEAAGNDFETDEFVELGNEIAGKNPNRAPPLSDLCLIISFFFVQMLSSKTLMTRNYKDGHFTGSKHTRRALIQSPRCQLWNSWGTTYMPWQEIAVMTPKTASRHQR